MLDAFSRESGISSKGALSLVLVITRNAKSKTPPFEETDFVTPQGGQVAGLGRGAVQKILSDYGIKRVLAEEGGRTSRGSLGRMRKYVELLNSLSNEGILDLDKIESWWISRIRMYFASKPLRIRADSARSLRSIVQSLMDAAVERQEECPGMMVAGAVIQHLVGAKLAIALPDQHIEHHGFSVADAPSQRPGDFLIADTAVHVTTAPTESLMHKCARNLEQDLRPLVITTEIGVTVAHALAKNLHIEDRIDILSVEQFLITNVYEWCGFDQSRRPVSMSDLIDRYNEIIGTCETDPSLRIVFG